MAVVDLQAAAVAASTVAADSAVADLAAVTAKVVSELLHPATNVGCPRFRAAFFAALTWESRTHRPGNRLKMEAQIFQFAADRWLPQQFQKSLHRRPM